MAENQRPKPFKGGQAFLGTPVKGGLTFLALKGRLVPEESVEFYLKRLLDALPFLEVLSPVCAK